MHALISVSTGRDFALWWVFMKQRDRFTRLHGMSVTLV